MRVKKYDTMHPPMIQSSAYTKSMPRIDQSGKIMIVVAATTPKIK